MSVILKLDQNYEVKEVWYGRTIIRSRYKLSYEVAQELCDGAAASEVKGQIFELVNSELTVEEVEKRYKTKVPEYNRSIFSISSTFSHYIILFVVWRSCVVQW